MLSASYLLIERVQHQVNAGTQYRADIDLYGQPEFWECADGAGDCEDYALAKRRLLMNQLVNPFIQLRLAVVFTETAEGQARLAVKRRHYPAFDYVMGDHAVLVATVPEGDYLLDNRFPDPMPLAETGYTIDRIQLAGTRDWEHGAL